MSEFFGIVGAALAEQTLFNVEIRRTASHRRLDVVHHVMIRGRKLLLLLLLLNVMAAGVHERSFVRCRGDGCLVESGAMVKRQKRCDVRRRMC